jgi:hypothetical protein
VHEVQFLPIPFAMKSGFWTYKAINPETRSKVITLFLCLLFSFSAWLSIKISRETSITVPLEIRVNNLPDNIIFTHVTDSAFTLSLRATGIRFLTNPSLRNESSLETDFGALQRMRGTDDIFFFTASQAELRFSLYNELHRTSVRAQPDTIFFTATDAFTQKVPVFAQLDVDYRPGFRLYGFPVISPDSVYITGPEWLEDSVRFIRTDIIRAESVDKPLSRRVRLLDPIPGQPFKISENYANVLIPVEEYTEATVELTLEIYCPDIERRFPGSRILLFPETVNVHYLVAFRDIRNISADMFRIAVQCPDTLAQTGTRLPVTVTEFPGMVEILRIRPSDVEYVWIRN